MAERERDEETGMGIRSHDLAGQRFSRLLVLSEAGRSKDRKILWLCRCDCGTEVTVSGKRLRNGESKSCGCLKAELLAARNHRHGHAGTRLYKIWQGMLKRCTNPSDRNFHKYGGRGITVCERWTSFENFHTDMAGGYADDLTLDRINPEGNYELGNCRWATQKEQQRNRTNNRLVSYEGSTRTLAEWCEQLDLPYRAIMQRLLAGWSVERAFNTPVRATARPPRPHPQGVAS
ncbi:hypothetical protein ACWD25_25405 [Streptomyces sp. NPDC002920]